MPLVGLLDTSELERHDRLKLESSRRLFRVAHALARRLLGEVADCDPSRLRFSIGPHGRPEIEQPGGTGWRFNLTHTEGLVAAIVNPGETCGVDVERLDRTNDLLAVAARMFSPRERDSLIHLNDSERALRFARYWTLKEAYVKARGAGLTLPTREVEFALDASPPSVTLGPRLQDDEAAWSFGELRPSPRHVLAWALPRSADDRPVTTDEWTLESLAP